MMNALPDYPKMVASQIAARGITDSRVLAALQTVPRHRFVPPQQQAMAGEDRPLPIGCGQTISQPYIVAVMTELLDLRPTDKVLEVGTGCGYQAAVLAEIVAGVYTVDIIPELVERAKENLRQTGYDNIAVRASNGFHGWPEKAPFDAILVAATAEEVPPPLVGQLARNGRMVIPLGSAAGVQHLYRLVKDENDRASQEAKMAVRFVPLTGAEHAGAGR